MLAQVLSAPLRLPQYTLRGRMPSARRKSARKDGMNSLEVSAPKAGANLSEGEMSPASAIAGGAPQAGEQANDETPGVSDTPTPDSFAIQDDDPQYCFQLRSAKHCGTCWGSGKYWHSGQGTCPCCEVPTSCPGCQEERSRGRQVGRHEVNAHILRRLERQAVDARDGQGTPTILLCESGYHRAPMAPALLAAIAMKAGSRNA